MGPRPFSILILLLFWYRWWQPIGYTFLRLSANISRIPTPLHSSLVCTWTHRYPFPRANRSLTRGIVCDRLFCCTLLHYSIIIRSHLPYSRPFFFPFLPFFTSQFVCHSSLLFSLTSRIFLNQRSTLKIRIQIRQIEGQRFEGNYKFSVLLNAVWDSADNNCRKKERERKTRSVKKTTKVRCSGADKKGSPTWSVPRIMCCSYRGTKMVRKQ